MYCFTQFVDVRDGRASSCGVSRRPVLGRRRSRARGYGQGYRPGAVSSSHSHRANTPRTYLPYPLLAGNVLCAALFLLLVASPASANHSVQDQISTGPAGGSGPFAAAYVGASDDGSRVFFETQEPLVATDTDGNCLDDDEGQPPRPCNDVYERFGGVTRILSVGPGGSSNGPFDAQFLGSSADGAHVFFASDEALVSSDTDTTTDVYDAFAGTTTLVSIGSVGGNGDEPAIFGGATPDGSHVYFETREALVSGDSDTTTDVYERASGSTTLISTGPAGGNNSAYPARFEATSTTGSSVLFTTEEPLVSADTDSGCGSRPCTDIYQRASGVTTLVSTGPVGGSGSFNADVVAASPNGQRTIFSTAEHLTSNDTDSRIDLYSRLGTTTTLLSLGPTGGNGAADVTEAETSDNAAHVFFETSEPLVASDTDTTTDIYERYQGVTTLASTGSAGGNGAFDASLEGASPDGSHVFIATAEPLVTGDTDAATDIYQRVGGATSRVSTGVTGGNGSFDAALATASYSGSRVFFETQESLVSDDTDTAVDVYERVGNTTTRISTGPAGGNAALDATLAGASMDGLFIFIQTPEQLLSSDTDSLDDVYVSSMGLPAPCTNRYTPADLTDFQGQLNNLPDGAVACLDAGIYGTEAQTQTISNDRLTIRSTPGHLAAIRARLSIAAERVTISNIGLDGATTPTPTAATVTVSADTVTFDHVNITNENIAVSCVSTIATSDGTPAEAVGIHFSKIYDCGAGAGQYGIDFGNAYRAGVDNSWVFENGAEGIRLGPIADRVYVQNTVVADNCSRASSCAGNVVFVENGYTQAVTRSGIADSTLAFPHLGDNAAAVTVSGDNNYLATSCVWRGDGTAGVNLPQPPFAVDFVLANPSFTDRTNYVHVWRNYTITNTAQCPGKGPAGLPGP